MQLKSMTLPQRTLAVGKVAALVLAGVCAAGGAGAAGQGAAGGKPVTIASQRAEAMTIAQRDLAALVKDFAGQRLAGQQGEMPFGLAAAELAQARVVYGFPVYAVDPVELQGGKKGLSAVAKANGQWRFVVAVGARPVGLATVEEVDGQLTTVAYGGVELAKDVDAMFARHGNAERSNLRFVRSYQAGVDLLEVQGADARTRFAPFHSARAKLGLQRDELLDDSVLLRPLRDATAHNINKHR